MLMILHLIVYYYSLPNKMSDTLTLNTNYTSRKEDPLLLLELIDKYVKVHAIQNSSYIGFVHSLDPVNYSIILLVPDDDKYKTTIIPGHAILDVTEEDKPSHIELPQRKVAELDSKEQILERRMQILSWLKANLLPVTEEDDKIVICDVALLPPYKSLDICTQNPIVACQISKLLDKMPKDFGRD